MVRAAAALVSIASALVMSGVSIQAIHPEMRLALDIQPLQDPSDGKQN